MPCHGAPPCAPARGNGALRCARRTHASTCSVRSDAGTSHPKRVRARSGLLTAGLECWPRRRRWQRRRGARASCRDGDAVERPTWRVVLAAGGTGGHVFPALSVAEAVRELGEARGWNVSISLMGDPRRMEWRLAKEHGLPTHPVKAVSLRRPLWLPWNVLAPFRVLMSIIKAAMYVARVRPHVLLGTGGYVSVPGCLAARLLGVPVVIQEQNARPGLANRLLAPLAAHVCVAHPSACQQLRAPRGRCSVLGNPVRESILQVGREREAVWRLMDWREERQRARARGASRNLLVLGGSLGAPPINRAVLGSLVDLLHSLQPDVRIVWQTGRAAHHEVCREVRALGIDPQGPRLTVVPFLDDMAKEYANAALVVARAGALTCSELLASGTPAVLIPAPHVAEDHQRLNAEAMADAGAAVAVLQRSLTPERLFEEVLGLFDDGARLRAMAEAARRIAPESAAQEIARRVEEAAAKGRLGVPAAQVSHA